MENSSCLTGRQWISSQEDFSTNETLTKINAIQQGYCMRCGARVYAKLPNGKFYCRDCIELGRIVEGDLLVRNLELAEFSRMKNGGLTWQGSLTKRQAAVSCELVKNFNQRVDTLVHAVTGAGKTEMLFAAIAECISQGKRSCIATPRIDVVNELYPRFRAAFNTIKIGKYHGKEHHEPRLDQLTICTTHQLMKFYHAFDLLVIDEVDSFPYVENTQLHFAAKNAVKEDGVRTYLTATPTNDLLEKVKKKQLKILRLNRRFHGGLLPVPRELFFYRPFLLKQKINPRLLKEIDAVIKSGHQLLLFVPRIEQISIYVSALKNDARFSSVIVEGVHAMDKNRLAKVENFRQGKPQLLVTTTILERGVTFKHVWVIVVQADDEIYTSASLVQIAGRVGRAKDDTDGLVLFCYRKYTQNIRNALKQIREMNK